MTTATKIYETKQQFLRAPMDQLWNNPALSKDERGKLKALYDGRKQSTTKVITVPIRYTLSNTETGRMGYGRFYGQRGSLESLERALRGSLTDGLYTDVDIVNCHPVLLSQIAKQHNHPTPVLDHYVSNRTDVFETMRESHNLTKETVKTLVLSALYGGALDADAPDMFRSMNQEIEAVIKALIPNHADLYKFLQSDKKKNIKGRFLALILQTEERKCLEAILAYLSDAGYTVDVLAYDGCMVRKEKELTQEHLRNCCAFVKAQTGYDISLAIKPSEHLDNSFFTENVSVVESDVYKSLKTVWETNHFYYPETNCIVEQDEDGLHHYNLETCKLYFNNWRLPSSDPEKINLFHTQWLTDLSRRTVKRFVYKMPQDCLADECSLFMGFDYLNIKESYTPQQQEEAVSLFRDILGGVCKDDAPVMDYVEKGFAHMLQKPFVKTGVCVVFASPTQGTGKDTVLQVLKRIIGNAHTAHYTSTEAYWDKHNTKSEGAIFEYLEEACSHLNKAKANEMKARITSDSISINPKGLKAYSVPNIARQYMTSNEVEPMKLEESDRRFMLIAPGDRNVKRDWCAVYATLFKPQSIKAIGDYLASIDITGWEPRRFPITEEKQMMAEMSITSEKRFLQQWTATEWLSGSELYNEYKRFCETERISYKQSAVSFCKSIISERGKYYQVQKNHITKNWNYAPVAGITGGVDGVGPVGAGEGV